MKILTDGVKLTSFLSDHPIYVAEEITSIVPQHEWIDEKWVFKNSLVRLKEGSSFACAETPSEVMAALIQQSNGKETNEAPDSKD